MANGKASMGRTESREVRKPFLTGSAFDERTVRNGLFFFGTLIMVFFIAFIACATASFDSLILRLLMNAAVIILILFIFFNNGSRRGTEDVAKGEILWQKKERGQPFSDSERKVCFHPMKGYIIGLIGSSLFIILAIYLALNTSRQMTGSGTLPSWMQAYIARSDIGNALINYTQPEGMGMTDYIRAAVRIMILPYVNIVGSSNSTGILVVERLSPFILLLPAAAYGTGYLSGRKVRTRIHTAISENDRKRIRRERRKKAERTSPARSRGPEQLN